MSEPQTPEPHTSAPAPQRRKNPPWWGILVFLGLLIAMVIVNYLATTSGPEIPWIDGGVDDALAQIDDQKRRVFLYLYEPGDPTHARNEREVFTQHWARQPLQDLVCCRIALRDDARSRALAARFNYDGEPLFLLLNPEGTPVSRTEGAVTETMFYTYVTNPAQRAADVDQEEPAP